MVGNLAEVATREIGQPLLARVGAYFHDIGKLKRPHFLKRTNFQIILMIANPEFKHPGHYVSYQGR